MSSDKTTYQILQDGYSLDLWYDWFCSEKSLESRGKKLLNKVKQISLSKRFDINTTYVFFKNNCPMVGNLYDDFRICDKQSGAVLYTVTPASGFTRSLGVAEVWGKENNFSEALVTGKWADVVAFFEKAPEQKVANFNDGDHEIEVQHE